MKKLILLLIMPILVILSLLNDNKTTLPKQSIRFRIVASDNTFESQMQKWKINEQLIPIISTITSEASSIEETRNLIKKNIPRIEDVVQNYSDKYDISYGNNYFPQKEYHDVIYPEGYYESLVIYLDKAQGDNWWCVMFPPLCLLEAKMENTNDVKYDLYIKKIINKYL